MANKTPEELVALSNHLFEKQYPVLSLYQTLADHFYPERADFTTTRNVGSELADGLLDSFPVLVRRDLGNSFSAMLRDGDWFNVGVEGDVSYESKAWLQGSTKRLKSLLTNRKSGFVRSTKEGDHDYATFGQAVISCERNKQANGLLFRCWHLRDCAWFEDENGQVSGVFRKWSPTIDEAVRYFGRDKIDSKHLEKLKKNPFERIDIVHLVMPTDMYCSEGIENPYVSIYLDVKAKKIIEEIGINHRYYCVPRFQTIAGSPYAYSPATVVALPNARLIQAMTHTLMEAGERYARPPIIATQKAIRSDVDLGSDGITWVDDEYDERLGAALRTLPQDRGGFPIGDSMRDNVYEIMKSAFFLDKIRLPSDGVQRTAYEISELMKEYRRNNLPLFAPMEDEYNGQLCEIAFEVALANGFLGSVKDIPQELSDRDIEFRFNSPLSMDEEEKKATKFTQVGQLVAEAAQLDPSIADNVNFDEALRDAIAGIGAPATWMHSVDDVQADRKAQLANQAIEMAQQAAQGVEPEQV